MAINLSGYSGDDPNLRLGKRIKLLSDAFPQFSGNADLLTKLAKTDIEDGELLRQTGEIAGLKAFSATKETLEAQSKRTQREVFRKLPAIAQASLMKIGYEMPRNDYNETSLSLFGIDFGWKKREGILGNIANAVQTPAALGAFVVHSARQLGGGLMDLQNMGSEASQRAYRAVSARGSTTPEAMGTGFQRERVRASSSPFATGEYQYSDEWVAKKTQESEDLNKAIRDSRVAEAFYWLNQNVQQGNISQVDASRIAAKGEKSILTWYEDSKDPDLLKGMDRFRAYSGSWSDAWRGMKNQGGSFRAQELMAAHANLDHDFGKINIAERVAMGDTAEEMLAERGIIIGTNEYRSELSKLQDEINDDKVQESVRLLKASTISFGTNVARQSGLQEGTLGFTLAAGVTEVMFATATDPTVYAGGVLKNVRAVRYGIEAADVAGEIGRIRNVVAAGDSIYRNADGSRKLGLALLAARDELTRARSIHRAVTSVVDAWNEGGRSFYQLLTEQPQLGPLIGFARKAVATSGPDAKITADALYDAMQTEAGVATILQGSARMYRKTGGKVVLPRIDLFNQTSGEIRGLLGRGVDLAVDYKISGKALSAEAITNKLGTGLLGQNLAAVAGGFERALAYIPTTAAQFMRLGVKVPYRNYVNLEDIGSIKEMLNLGSLTGITSVKQAEYLDDIIRGIDRGAGVVDQATSLAAARSVVASFLSDMLGSLGIPAFAKGDPATLNASDLRQWKWSNDLMRTLGEAYDVRGDRLATLAGHASNNIHLPNVGQLARAAQNNMFLASMYRFMNPWWLESAVMRWKQLVTIAPRMGLRAGVEEGLTFLLREGPSRYSQALRAGSIYASERISTLERLASKALTEGNVARQQALLTEADRLRRMPGLRAIAGGIEWLANSNKVQGTVAGPVVDAMSRFTNAVTAHVTDYYRRALGAIAPITDDQIRLGAEIWARDESAMALASVIDGRHTQIEAPMSDPFGSLADILDGGGNPIEVSMTGGGGYQLVQTQTGDMFQTLNRLREMTRHARDPFTEEVMRRLMGAHTELERTAILGAFTSVEKKNKNFRKLFRIPASVPEEERFDWAINRFRETVAEMHPSVREDVIKSLRNELMDTGTVQALEEKQQAAIEAGNFVLSQEVGRELAGLRRGGANQSVTLAGKLFNDMNEQRAALDGYVQAFKDLEKTRKFTKPAQDSLKAAINARDASLATTKEAKAIARRVIDDLNTGSPSKATTDFIGALKRRPKARKAINDAYAEWQVWDRSINNYEGIRELTKGMDLRFKELLTYDGPMTRIGGSGPQAVQSWFKTEVMTAAAKNGLYNNQEIAANMDRMLRVPYADSQGRQVIGTVARPLKEGRVGIYWPTVDDGLANSLYKTMTDIDGMVAQGMTREDAIASVVDNMMFTKADGSFDVATSRQRYMMTKILSNTSRDGLWAYMKEAKSAGRGMLPFSNLTYANHDIADEISRTLHSGLGGKWIDEGKAVISTTDIATPKGIIQHPEYRPGGLLNVDFLPADSEVGTLPSRLSGSLTYATPDHLLFRGQPITPANKITLPDGTVTTGFTREDAVNSFAEAIAQSTIDRFTSPHTGGILHDVIHGIMRDEPDAYQRVANLKAGVDLPQQSVVPNIYLTAEKKGKFQKLAEFGYQKAVSPLIAGISRQPLFISALGEAATVARDWRKGLIALSTKEQGVAAMFAARGIKFDEVVKVWESLGPYETRPGVSLKKMMSVFAENGIPLTDHVEAKGVRDALSYLTHIDRMERNIAYERAFNNILPYIDDHNIKTFASTYMKGFVPFMYAEEQFMRRWLRTLIDNPFALHRAQMYLGAMRTIGIVQKDEQTGQYTFSYPLIPAWADFLGKFPVIGDFFFGGTGRLPNGIELKAAVSESLPGFKNPGQIMPGPMFTVGMAAVRHFLGDSEAVADDLIESATGRRPNPKSIAQDLLINMLPGYASRFVKAQFSGLDSSEELTRTSIQAAMMFGAEGQAYMRKANDAKAKGNMQAYERYKLKAEELLPPTDTEDKEAMEHYRHRIQVAARQMMFIRGVTGFAGFGTSYVRGEEYQMTDKFNDYLKAIDPTDPDGYSKAVGKFLARYPDALPYTVKGSVSESKAPVPMSGGTYEWMRQNEAIFKSDPLGASWLIPPDPGGERDPRVWGRLRAMEVYKQRDLKDWAVAYHMAASGTSFYRNKDAFDKAMADYKDNPDVKRSLRAAWSEWRNQFMNANPVFEREQRSGKSGTRREQVLNEIMRIAESEKAPADEYAQNIFTIARNYMNYKNALANIYGTTKAADAQRQALRIGFWQYGERWMNYDAALAGFWNGVVAPDAFPEDFNPYE